MTPPIIDHRQQRGPGRRGAAGTLTIAVWLVYAWLWAPLVTAVAWVVGIRTAWSELYLRQHEVDLFVLASLPLIALLCGTLLIGWAEYNRARFANDERRQRKPDVDDTTVRTALGASAALAGKLRDGRVVRVALDDDARPVAAQLGS